MIMNNHIHLLVTASANKILPQLKIKLLNLETLTQLLHGNHSRIMCPNTILVAIFIYWSRTVASPSIVDILAYLQFACAVIKPLSLFLTQ